MVDDPTKKLEARIVELEQRLGQLQRRPEATDISAEELKAYQKVRAQLTADWGEECGINECLKLCFRCHRCGTASFRCIWRCINECACGPCIMGDLGGGGGLGGSGFGGFGG